MFEKTCFFLILFLFHPCIPLYYCQCVFWVLGNKYTAAGNRKYDGCTFSFNVYNNIPLKRDHPSRLKLGNLKYFVEGDVRFRSETLWKILFFSPSSFSIIIFFHATINPLHMLPEKPQKKVLEIFIQFTWAGGWWYFRIYVLFLRTGFFVWGEENWADGFLSSVAFQ